MVSSTLTKTLIIASICGSVNSFSSRQVRSQDTTVHSQLYSATPCLEDDAYENFASSSYFNAPTSPADELRWGRNINSRFTQQRSIVNSMQSESERVAEEQSRLRKTLQAAKQAFRDSREIEAYNLINDLEKGSRRMDGPTRSRLASVQPVTSMDDVKERYRISSQEQHYQQQQNENFVVQYSESEGLDLQKSFGDFVDGNTVDYAVIRAASIAGKRAAHVIGGKDPENWID